MKRFLFWVLASFSLLHGIAGHAQADKRLAQFNIDQQKQAIQGYDPVAYFVSKKAIKGNKAFALSHSGITYYFSSAANKEIFRAAPDTYEPQYGGWCAYAMGATGEKVEVDPETFKIVQGKLYLFYHSWTNNTLPKWNKDEVSLQKKADQHWKQFFK